MNVVGIKKLIKKNEYFGFFGKKTKHVIKHIIKNQWTNPSLNSFNNAPYPSSPKKTIAPLSPKPSGNSPIITL